MYILKNDTVKQNCIREIENTLTCDPPQYEVVIKKATKNKTTLQRNYFHKILEIICDYTGDYLEATREIILWKHKSQF